MLFATLKKSQANMKALLYQPLKPIRYVHWFWYINK